jgi:hypothetical protein
MTGEMTRRVLVAEIERVGGHHHGLAALNRSAERLPGHVVRGFDPIDQRHAGIQSEVVLESRRPAVEHPRGTHAFVSEVEKAQATGETEDHPLGKVRTAVSQDVAKRRRGAVLTRAVRIIRDPDALRAHRQMLSRVTHRGRGEVG